MEAATTGGRRPRLRVAAQLIAAILVQILRGVAGGGRGRIAGGSGFYANQGRGIKSGEEEDFGAKLFSAVLVIVAWVAGPFVLICACAGCIIAYTRWKQRGASHRENEDGKWGRGGGHEAQIHA